MKHPSEYIKITVLISFLLPVNGEIYLLPVLELFLVLLHMGGEDTNEIVVSGS